MAVAPAQPGADEERLRDRRLDVHEGARRISRQRVDLVQPRPRLSCEATANPDKSTDFATRAIYEFVRAAVVDPSLGGTHQCQGDQRLREYGLHGYHGSDEGLDQLKQQAKASPLPPAGFKIESATAASARKQKEFAEKYPQFALWMGIKGQLTDANGQQYFEGQLKDADVAGQGGQRALKGMVLEGRPACRSKELLLAVPEPDSRPDARDHAQAGLCPDRQTRLPARRSSSTRSRAPSRRSPFMLTMETEKSKITGLKVDPCAAAPARSTKKGVTRKKK